MKKILLCLMALGVFWPGSSQATQVGATLDVTMELNGVCTVSTTPVVIIYTGGQYPEGQGEVQVTCASGTIYAVALDAGQYLGLAKAGKRSMSDGAGHFIEYEMANPWHEAWGDQNYGDTYPNYPAWGNVGSGSQDSITVYGIANIPPVYTLGTYSDIVNVTVNF